MTFYERYSTVCSERGIDPCSQHIAEIIGVTRESILLWNSRGTTPNVKIVSTIATVLNISPDYLLGRTNNQANSINQEHTITSRKMIANKLKLMREKSGMTANQVGNKIGKSGKTVNAWENNRGQPDIDTLYKLSEIYGVPDILSELKEEKSLKEYKEKGEYFSLLKSRPEMRMLFSVMENASKEDVEKTVAILEVLKSKKDTK